jgi:hypothetical protein
VQNWERLPRKMTMSIQHSGGETPPPWPSYGGTLRSTFFLSLGKLTKSSKSITAVRQAIWRNSDARRGFRLHCQFYVWGTWIQCTEAFYPPSLNSNLRSDPLKRRSKNSRWKESRFSSQKRHSGQGTPRCHPKAEDAPSWYNLRLQSWLSLGPL